MNAYWQNEMRQNAAREHALMSGPNGDFYRRWKNNGSPNSMNERYDHPASAKSPPRKPFPKGIRKVKAPTRNNVAGRTWDSCTVLMPDGSKVIGYLDTTWGTRFYFQAGGWNGDWYAGNMYDFELHGQGMALVYCLREDRYGVRIGDTVCLTDAPEAGEAKIIGFYDHEGGVLIEPMLDGFRSWNIGELTVTHRTKRG